MSKGARNRAARDRTELLAGRASHRAEFLANKRKVSLVKQFKGKRRKSPTPWWAGLRMRIRTGRRSHTL